MNEKLHIQIEYANPGMNTFSIEGLSVKEMNRILDAETWEIQRDILAELLDEHENDYRPGHSLGTSWRNGYGIYNIRHVGGHLFVSVGSSCD